MSEAVRRDAAGVLLVGFVGPDLPAWVADALPRGLGGVCLFGSNVRSEAQLRALTASIRTLRPDAVVAVDEEGGDVTRLHVPDGSPEPGNALLGRADDPALTAASARRIGDELARAGVTLDLAPVADVNTDADNPVIGARSFGADAQAASRHVAAWVRGLQSADVAACAKHFPGHGDTAVDSHLGLPVIEHDLEVLRGRELLPFTAAIRAGVASIMTSHIVLPLLDPDAPATMSRRILTGLLRDELGFEGVIITDALDMAGASGAIGIPAAAVASLRAGADLLCLGSDSAPHLDAVLAAVVAAVESGELPTERLQEAAGRVRRLADRVHEDSSGRFLGEDGAEPSDARRQERADPADARPADADPADAYSIDAHPTDAHPSDAYSAFDRSAFDRSAADRSAADRSSSGLADLFDVQPAARAALGEPGGWTVVRLEAEPNIAVGPADWGPFAAAAAAPRSPGAPAFGSWPLIDVAVDEPGPVPQVAGRALVVGRDLHRHPHARAAVDGLRAAGGTVVVVDMGWPSPDRAYADVATFGGSRAAGAALLQLLDRLEGP